MEDAIYSSRFMKQNAPGVSESSLQQDTEIEPSILDLDTKERSTSQEISPGIPRLG